MPTSSPGRRVMARLPVLVRKAVRDVAGMGGAALAIAMVMACGVVTFVSSLSALDSIARALDSYYDRAGFPHVFAELKRAPLSLLERVRTIPGVSRAEARVVREIVLDIPGMSEPGTARIISIPSGGEPAMCRVHLVRGRGPMPDRQDEILVLEGFARAHALEPGDTIPGILNGRLRDLMIVGIALSPEFIYPVRPGEMLPDNRHYGVFWMDEHQLAPAFDLDGAFNSLVLTLSPGASEAGVIRAVDELTAPYGGAGAIGRADQVSHRFLVNEMDQLRSQALVVPVIFLAVTAFLLQMVVSRVLGTQREQIATLKAFGYTRGEITRHFLMIVGSIAVLGAVLGIAAGARLGLFMTDLYAGFFRFPVFRYRLAPWIGVAAVGVALGTGYLATIMPIRRATGVPAAQAMRPEAPAVYRRSLLEMIGVWRWTPTGVRMVVRNLERRPVRSLMTSMGAAVAIGVLVVGNFVVDTIDALMEFQFNRANLQTLTVSFTEPAGPRAGAALQSIPGVQRVEVFRAVPARLHAGHISRRIAVTGLPADRSLQPLLDRTGRAHGLPPGALLISSKLAEILRVAPGDRVRVDILEGRRPMLEWRVGAVLDDLSGLNAYARLEDVQEVMREGYTISGAFVRTSPGQEVAVYRELKQTPRIAGVTVTAAMRRTFEETVAATLLQSRAINLVFAVLIAGGVVYNSGRIALAERARDLATLRVLGFTRREVAGILVAEQYLLTLAAILPGLALGWSLAWLSTLLIDTENHRFPLVIHGRTYAVATLVTIAAAVCTAVAVSRRVAALSLVAVLKTRE